MTYTFLFVLAEGLTSSINPPSTTFVHVKNPTMRWSSPSVDSSNTLKVLKKRLSTAKSSSDLFDLDWIYLVDSGGQPQFADILPLLFGSEALYLMVVRLDQDLDDKQDNCFCDRGETYKLPETLTLTHYQMIERACQIAEAQSTKLSPKRVVVIATRYDEVVNPEDRVRKFNERLLKLHQEYEDVLVPSDISCDRVIFPVNAMSTGAEREKYTSQLQECLIDIVRRSIKPVEVPLKWFVYELDLDDESEKTCGVVKKSRSFELGKHLGMETTEIESSLRFFNRLALHLYHPDDDDFPDLVLIKMDPLTDRLSALIRTSFDPPQHIITKDCSVLKECGIFHELFLDDAFTSITDQAISNHCFLQITQCLKVIVSVGDGRYFIPSALSVDKHQQIERLSQHVPCAFDWKESILPPGFFCTLIVMLLQLQDASFEESHFSLPFRRENVCQSRDHIILDVKVLGGKLTLTNEHKQIWLTYKCEGSCSQDYINVIQLVVQTLNKVVKFFSKMVAVSSLNVCFPCPKCVTLHPCKSRHQHNICTETSSKHPLTDEMRNIMKAVNSFRGLLIILIMPYIGGDTGGLNPSLTVLSIRAADPLYIVML